MTLKLASTNGQTGRLIVVAAALLVGACGGGSASSDGGGGNGGNAAAGASGRGGSGGHGGNGGGAGTTGAAGSGGASTPGTAGTGGAAGSGGGLGGSAGGGAAGTTGGSGGRGGAAGSAGRGGTGGAVVGTGGAIGVGGAGGRGGNGGNGAGGAAGSGGSGGTGTSCTSNADCQGLSFCDFSNNLCAGSGTCKMKSLDCVVLTPKVCGCDGHIYDGECEANGSVDISDMGNCTPPSGTFACGHLFCMKGAEYCEKMVGGAATNPGSYACHALPAGCNGTPSCACVAGSAQCGNCTTSANGDVMTACLFP